MRKVSILVLVAVLASTVFIQSGFARGKDCDYKMMKKHRYYKKDKDYNKGMFCGKFYKKAKYALKYQDKIKLTDEQVDKIIDLKMSLKKEMINKKAQIEIILLDIKKELYSDDVNVDKVNNLIDKKYNLKAEKTKSALKAYSELKNVLKDEQMDKLKEIWKEKKKYYRGMKKKSHYDKEKDEDKSYHGMGGMRHMMD